MIAIVQHGKIRSQCKHVDIGLFFLATKRDGLALNALDG